MTCFLAHSRLKLEKSEIKNSRLFNVVMVRKYAILPLGLVSVILRYSISGGMSNLKPSSEIVFLKNSIANLVYNLSRIISHIR